MTRTIETQIWDALKTVTDVREAFNVCDRFNLSNADTNRIVKSWQMKNQMLQRA
jgi:hypothetical protein